MPWDFETGTFVPEPKEEVAPDPLASLTPAPTPVPGVEGTHVAKPGEQTIKAPPTKPIDYSGNVLSDIANVAKSVPDQAAAFVRALPQLPAALAGDVNDALSLLTGGYSDKALAAAEKLPQPNIPGGLGIEAAERQAQPGPKTISEIRPDNLLQLPIVRTVVPGSFVGDKAIHDPAALGQEPLIAALDVLPIVGKLGKAATKGTQFAGRAADAAEAAGKPHIAADIADQGLKPAQMVGQAVRDVESKLIPKSQKVAAIRPTLEEMGVTWRGRSMQDLVGQAQRKVGGETQRFANEVDDAQKRLGISPERSRELTALARTPDSPNWLSSLPDNERQYLQFFEEVNKRAQAEDIARGQGFKWNGDFYSRAEAPKLASIARRKAFYEKIAESSGKRAGESRTVSDMRKVRELEAESYRLRGTLDIKLMSGLKLTPEEHAAFAESRRLYDEAQTYRPNGGGRHARQSIRAQKKIAELQAVGDDMASRLPPTKWHDTLRQRSLEQAREAIRQANPPEAWDEMLRNLDSGAFHRLQGFTEDDWKLLVDSQWKSWQRLKEEGVEPPQFVSHAPVDAPAKLEKPYFIPKNQRSPGSVKARAKYDYRPYTDDLAVAARYDHLERVQRIAAEDFVGKMRERGWIRNKADVMDEIDSMIGHLAKDGLELKELRDLTAEKFYRNYRPTSIFTGQAENILREGDFIPTGLYKLLEDMAQVPKKRIVSKPLEWGAGLLRTSVLRLNPFYYFGNAVSGIPLLLAKGGPTHLKHIPEAIKMIREHKVPDWVPTGPRKVIGEVEDAYRFRAGASLGTMLEHHWGPARFAERASKFSDRVVTVLDDMYRTSAALGEFNRALKKGRSEDVAIAQAVDFASKVMNNLDRLTPTERYVVKSVFPFYSWSSHLLRYVLSYPFDHPWRAMLTTKLARQALEEWEEDLPQKMMRYIALGSDKEGWQWFVGANDLLPWVSISEIGSMAGLMSRLHPGYKAALEYAGLDPFTGGPQRYPDYTKEKDPVTGKQSFVRPPLSELLVENLLPQSEMFLQEDWQEEFQAEKPGGGKLEEVLRALGAPVFMRRTEEPVPAAPKAPVTASKGKWNFETGRFE